MITYRAHVVYVVTGAFPLDGKPCKVVRVATKADLGGQLGVLVEDGECIPLSPYEADRVREVHS